MHVLLDTRHGAALDAATTGGGAGCPRAAFPTEKKKGLVRKADRADVAEHLISDIPRQWVVEVVRHDLLVAVARGPEDRKDSGQNSMGKDLAKFRAAVYHLARQGSMLHS